MCHKLRRSGEIATLVSMRTLRTLTDDELDNLDSEDDRLMQADYPEEDRVGEWPGNDAPYEELAQNLVERAWSGVRGRFDGALPIDLAVFLGGLLSDHEELQERVRELEVELSKR